MVPLRHPGEHTKRRRRDGVGLGSRNGEVGRMQVGRRRWHLPQRRSRRPRKTLRAAEKEQLLHRREGGSWELPEQSQWQ